MLCNPQINGGPVIDIMRGGGDLCCYSMLCNPQIKGEPLIDITREGQFCVVTQCWLSHK